LPEISGNLLTAYVNHVFPSAALQSDALDKQLSRSLCFSFMHYVQKNNSLSAWLPQILANSNENYKLYNFHAFASVSGNFRNY